MTTKQVKSRIECVVSFEHDPLSLEDYVVFHFSQKKLFSLAARLSSQDLPGTWALKNPARIVMAKSEAGAK